MPYEPAPPHPSPVAENKEKSRLFRPGQPTETYRENAVIWKGLDRVEGGVERTIATGRMKPDPTASNRARRR